MKLDEDEFDPCEAARAGLRPLEGLAEAKQVELTALLDEPAPVIRGNAQMFCQVCLKLAGNAVKFSPMGSQVIVICSVDKGELHLIVEDNGPGIGPEELAKVAPNAGAPSAAHQALNRRQSEARPWTVRSA